MATKKVAVPTSAEELAALSNSQAIIVAFEHIDPVQPIEMNGVKRLDQMKAVYRNTAFIADCRQHIATELGLVA
jgi:hypothetical protein